MRRLVIIFFFTNSIQVWAQNLVHNPSFEQNLGCPFSGGQIDGVENWISVFGSVDYYNECGTNGYGIPVSWGGGQYARTGQVYLGIAVWSLWVINGHEFLGESLIDSLISGKKYNVEFYLNMSDSNWYAVRNIGAYFSKMQPSPNISELYSAEPQIKYSDTMFLTDKKEWLKIGGSFIAQGGEKFITIGNFDDDAHTDTLFIDSGAVYRPAMPYYWTNSYYFIDDVSVTLDTTYVGVNEPEAETKFNVYPNPVKEKITIELAVGSCQLASVIFYDITGRAVLSILIQSSKNTIDVSSLSSGVYTAVLSEKGIPSSRRKIVVE